MMKSEITLSFKRNVRSPSDNQENFTYLFEFDEDQDGLRTILEKMEVFLVSLGFVLDNQQLDVVTIPQYEEHDNVVGFGPRLVVPLDELE
jgi:hypothetical protein